MNLKISVVWEWKHHFKTLQFIWEMAKKPMTLFHEQNIIINMEKICFFGGAEMHLHFREAKSQLFVFSKSRILRKLMWIAKEAMLTP